MKNIPLSTSTALPSDPFAAHARTARRLGRITTVTLMIVFPPFLVALIVRMVQRSFLHVAASWRQSDRDV
jgi:hypothetical protein